MVSFADAALTDSAPIYLQIILFVKRGIVAGTIGDQEEMPSRRVLSALLGVNPNTVQKAYRMLEDEELITSHSGAKSYVSVDEKKVEEIRRQLLKDDLGRLLSAIRQTGVSKAEALSLIDRLWEEEQ